MTDFGPLIANPISFLLGAAAQFGIFAAYSLRSWHGILMIRQQPQYPSSVERTVRLPFSLQENLDRQVLLGPIAVAAYSYMSLSADHSATDHEVTDNEKRTCDQDGAI